MINKIILFSLSLFWIINLSQAATYYISPRGNDAQAGTSASAAWRTIGRVNAATFQPGDRVLFEGGQTFAGSIYLQAASQGTAVQPLLVSSYGTGRATIASGASYGFYAENNAGIELRRLNFVGSGRLSNTDSGVIFYVDAPNAHLQYLRLDSLDVSGYQKTGISVSSWNGTSGYTDVRITACQAHANGEAGLASYGEDLAAHHNWYVGYCQVYDNPGRADVTTIHTGNGIVLGSIDGVLVDHCVAYNNGWLSAWPNGGPVGIWGYCCNNLVIQKCESHHNSSGTSLDGGGFDLDGGCTNSVMQYNYSHDNGGAGYLLAQYPGAPAMSDLIVRYNVSENDARRNSQGGILIWSSGDNGGIQRASIHNNTVLLSPPADGSRPKAVLVSSAGISDISLRNNVLQTTGGLPVLSTVTATGLRFEGNCYWTDGAPLVLEWNGTTYTDLPAWRAATGQEQLASGRTTGLSADPQLVNSTPNYMPMPASPVRGAGLDLQTEFNLGPGPRDFLGNPTPQAPARGNIGALEAQAATTPLPVVLTAFTAEQQGTAAVLRWNTASEQNNAYFDVESGLDGRTFTPLGQVAGQGTGTGPRTYQFTDEHLARYTTPAVYYRLRQVDADGKATYSPVRALTGHWAGAEGLYVAPNPALIGTTAVVRGANGTRVQLVDVRGQLVASAPVLADGTAALPLVGLAAGVYIVRCGPDNFRLFLEN